MKIAILAATEYELSLIRGWDLGFRIWVVKTGIGPQKARTAIESLLKSNRPDLVIVCGMCGGLQDHIKKGDVIIAHSFIYGEKKIESNPNEIQNAIREIAQESRISYHFGSSLTVEKALLTSEEKKEAGEKYNALAVEMENFPIAEACKNNGIPCISIRAVSDEVTDELDPRFFYVIDSSGNLRKRKLLRYLWKDPLFLFSLIKNAREMQRIRKNYSQLIQAFISSSQNLTPNP